MPSSTNAGSTSHGGHLPHNCCTTWAFNFVALLNNHTLHHLHCRLPQRRILSSTCLAKIQRLWLLGMTYPPSQQQSSKMILWWWCLWRPHRTRILLVRFLVFTLQFGPSPFYHRFLHTFHRSIMMLLWLTITTSHPVMLNRCTCCLIALARRLRSPSTIMVHLSSST